jgi:hypothetical protein
MAMLAGRENQRKESKVQVCRKTKPGPVFG